MYFVFWLRILLMAPPLALHSQDLDYSYNPIGELPRHIDSLAYPPAYFHKIVRNVGNPIVHIDLRPFAVDIADHLSLLQDRVQTETYVDLVTLY